MNADETLKLLIVELGLVRADPDGPQFKLASGKLTDYYIDMRRVILDWRATDIVPILLSDLIEDDVVYIGGVPTAGLLLINPVIKEAQQYRKPGAETIFGGFYVRPEAKKHGTGRQIEGNWKPGSVVCMLEDTVTTGQSLIEAANIARDHGLIVKYAACIFDREEGGREALAAQGIELSWVCNASDFGLK